ncbi:MAG: hypothetical protein NVSMB5_22520 [Candidatus Velthaea sp.]
MNSTDDPNEQKGCNEPGLFGLHCSLAADHGGAFHRAEIDRVDGGTYLQWPTGNELD